MRQLPICKAQSGSATLFFVLVGLPFLFLLAALTLGLEDFYQRYNHKQQAVDQLNSLTNSSNTNLAPAAGRRFLERHGLGANMHQVSAEQGQQNLVLDRQGERLNFANYHSQTNRIRTTYRSEYVQKSRNYTVVIDLSADDLETASTLPSAQYFDQFNTELEQTFYVGSSQELKARCFSGNILRKKLLAIELINQIKSASGELNLAFAPGYLGNLDSYILASDTRPPLSAIDPERFCAAAAQYESYQSEYQFPYRSAPAVSVVHVNSADMPLNREYQQHLSLEEVVWSKAAVNPGRNADFLQILSYLQQNIARLGSVQKSQQMFVITSSLPRINQQTSTDYQLIAAKLSQLAQAASTAGQRLVLDYVLIPQADLSDQPAFNLEYQKFKDWFAQNFQTEHLRLRLSLIKTADQLGALALEIENENKSSVLSR